ncbi:MAG: M20 family metallopeptidase [Clostridia bacterium]|nr:M20 family metallopeptidase [Clostridia bacterium]
MDLAQYLKELEYLVNIDSGSEDGEGVSKVADFFSEKFNEMGWNVHEYEFGTECGKCVICTNREAEHYDLLMIGHLDTVFPKGTCTERPFRIEGNRAYGPGVCDMKHGSLLMYYLLKELPEEVNEKLNIVAIFNPDEEIGSCYSKTVYEEYASKSNYGFVYESASEKDGCCAERQGGLFYDIDFIGKDGHSGYMFTNGSKSAIHEMGKWIVKFSEMASLEKGTTVNVGIANGGVKSNVVAPSASIKIDIRFKDNSEIERFDSAIEEMTAEATGRGIGVKTEKRVKKALVYTEETDRYIKHVEKITKENGIEFKHKARGGLSDANILAQYGVLCLDGLGPVGMKCHCPEEVMLIDTVIPYYNLSMLFIKDLAETKGKSYK